MKLPASLTIRNGAFALDGGTTHLSATDETGKEHSVLLVQHASANFDTPPEAIPGRLYFNGEMLDVRSATENALLELLRKADVRPKEAQQTAARDRISPHALIIGDDIKRVVQGSPEQNLREMLQGIIDYVASVKYVAFAAIMEEMRKEKR